MVMEISCPACESRKEISSISQEREISIRNERVRFLEEVRKCSKCGEEFLIPGLDKDPIENAFRVYRSMHGLLQPEEIREFRKKYNITQGELAKLLGLGGATISRYENGKLQDETHDTLLKMSMNCENLRKLVLNSKDVFSDRKRALVLQAINDNTGQMADCLREFITLNLEENIPDEYRGFKKFDIVKFTNAVLYFCKEGIVKTKLNKLMFYADFQHFKDNIISITGTQYARIPFGPAPNNYDLYYPTLNRQGLVAIEEIEFPEYSGDKYISKQDPDLGVFSDGELRVLATIKARFKDATATEMSALSHEEEGYKHTDTGKIISYQYAKDLIAVRNEAAI